MHALTTRVQYIAGITHARREEGGGGGRRAGQSEDPAKDILAPDAHALARMSSPSSLPPRNNTEEEEDSDGGRGREMGEGEVNFTTI